MSGASGASGATGAASASEGWRTSNARSPESRQSTVDSSVSRAVCSVHSVLPECAHIGGHI